MAAARDVVVIAGFLFAFGTALFIVNYTANTMFSSILSIATINQTTAARDAFVDTRNVANTRLDYIMFGFFIGLVLALIISGYYVGGEPVFMFFYFLIVVIGVLASMIMSNVWHNLTVDQATIFGTTVNNLPITNNIMVYLPIYIGVVGLIAMIVMFAKPLMSREL